MCLGLQRGLRCYDMSGYGRFKSKFGGELVTLRRWHKAYWRSRGGPARAMLFISAGGPGVRTWLMKFSRAPESKAAKSDEEG